VRFGHVEQDPVEVALVDSQRHVPDLHPVGGVWAESRGDVGPSPFREVRAELVADDRRACPQRRHGEGARADARLEHALAGTDVGRDQDGAQVLRIDHLGPAGHLEDHVAQRRAQDEEGTTRRTRDRPAFAAPDQVVVGDDAGVGVEGRSSNKRDEIATVLGVDEQDALPCHQRAGHVRQASTAAGGALGSRTVMSTCSPGATVTLDTALVRSFRTRRKNHVAPARKNQYQLPPIPLRTPARKKRRRRKSTSEPPNLDHGGLRATAAATGKEGERDDHDGDCAAHG